MYVRGRKITAYFYYSSPTGTNYLGIKIDLVDGSKSVGTMGLTLGLYLQGRSYEIRKPSNRYERLFPTSPDNKPYMEKKEKTKINGNL